MTANDILSFEFDKAGFKGYKAEQVDDFLEKTAKEFEELISKNNDLNYKIKILAEKIEQYKLDEENIREALLGAQKLGTSVVNEAKAKADALTKDSSSKSDTLMKNSKESANQIVEKANHTADEIITQAKTKADFITKDAVQKASLEMNHLKKEVDKEKRILESMKIEVSDFKKSILEQYKSHLSLLSNLPDIAVPSNYVSNRYSGSKENSTTDVPKVGEIESVEETDNIAKTQTIKSEIVLNEIEQPIDSEQTKEFSSKSRTRSKTEQHINVDNVAAINNDDTVHKVGFSEKFGELRFGTHKDSK